MQSYSYLKNLLPSKEDQRTAIYYILCLVVLNSMICLGHFLEHKKDDDFAILAAIFSSYCNLAMHCSGVLFGIVIARMVQADKEEAAKAESLKESLI